jgi:formylglycine-generating enzyme required for sulfatase activity
MVAIPGPVEFLMGSPRTEVGRQEGVSEPRETLHHRWVRRRFAVAAREVTMRQIRAFRRDFDEYARLSPTGDHPAQGVRWYVAAEYCNWLSEKEGIPPDQWCYEPDTKTGFAEGMRLKAGYLKLTGYRLPTEAEWEYAARAGAVTARFFGETDDLLGRYAWYAKNSEWRGAQPVGTLKPNDLGLFDVHGNVLEWCQERLRDYPPHEGDEAEDVEDPGEVKDRERRILRGGSFFYAPDFVRCAFRIYGQPTNRLAGFGFRVARMIP